MPVAQLQEDSDTNGVVLNHNVASADEGLFESSEDSDSLSDNTVCSKQRELNALQREGMFDPVQLHKSREFKFVV